MQDLNLERLPELLPAGVDLLRREEEPEAVVAQLSRENEAGALQQKELLQKERNHQCAPVASCLAEVPVLGHARARVFMK